MTVIDEVKARIDIVELVGAHVKLQKAGRNFKGLCPFHNEKTPSFIVTPDRQTWHCFGACGTGGDVFSFVMRSEDIEFGEALRQLGERAGVVLNDRRDTKEDESDQRLFQANEAAAAYFYNALVQSKAGAEARSYLTRRGLDADTIEAFQLGYSPDSWESLRSHLMERGFSGQELLNAGLLVESERGGYDRFRGRLMFPIRDERGRVVGFGGRHLETPGADKTEDPGAKYINTPRTALFDKGTILYALDRAKEAVRRERTVIVVEGYMDVIAAHQFGIEHTVAAMGTALTEAQIRVLERRKSKILLAMDADAAGIEATLRALREAAETGAVRAAPASAHPADVRDEDFAEQIQEWSRDALKRAAINFYVVQLSGKDPDEMIRADRAAWEKAVAGAVPFTEHIFNLVAARKDRSVPAERAELLQELLPIVRLIEEPTHRAHYVQRLARLAQLREDDVLAELQRRPARPGRREAQPEEPAGTPALREQGEEFCLALLLRQPELRADGKALSPELFLLGEHRAVFSAWHESPDLETIRAALPEALHAHLTRIIERDVPVLEGAMLHQALEDCVARIELRRLSAAKQASAAALAEPDVQPYMVAAVERAHALQRDAGDEGSPEQAEGNSRTSQLASTLVEDDEMGRKLHRSSGSPSPDRLEVSPEGEGRR